MSEGSGITWEYEDPSRRRIRPHWFGRIGEHRIWVFMCRRSTKWLILYGGDYIRTKSGGIRLFKNSKQAKAFCEEPRP